MSTNNTNGYDGLAEACKLFADKLAHSGIEQATRVSILAGRHVYAIQVNESKPIVYDKGQTLLVVRRGR